MRIEISRYVDQLDREIAKCGFGAVAAPYRERGADEQFLWDVRGQDAKSKKAE